MDRSDLEKLSKEEIIDLFIAIYDHFQTKMAELEARLNLNSQNSHNPPSTDTWKKPKPTRQKTGKKPGAQKGHKGHGLKIQRNPDQTITHKSAICKHCQTSLTEIPGTQTDTRYKIDINIQTQLTKHNQITVTCPNCQTQNPAAFPPDLTSTIQYGQGVKAISVLFTHYAMVSYDKTQKILNDIFNIPISTGTIVNHVSEFTQKAEPALNEIPQRLQGESVLHFDETGVNVAAGKHWLHTASSAQATYITVHPKRGQLGTDDNGVLTDFGGVAVHDCWQAYFKYENCSHALCNAHLLRELLGVVENTGQGWAVWMADFLRRLKLVVERCKMSGVVVLPECYRESFSEEYERILELGLGENPLVLGVRKRSKARCLLDRFIVYRVEVWRFALDFRVPFDNNQAERDIRNVKVKQKVSGGFRSVLGARNFGRIASIIGTSVKQEKSAYSTISGIFAGTVTSLFQKSPYD
jgi:transposase-like protein